MRVLLLGRKPVACAALRHMLAAGIEVPAVVAPTREEPDPYAERLADVADAAGVRVFANREIYELLVRGSRARSDRDLLSGVDLVVSLLHQKRILRPLIELARNGCINFHPAPLPEYRGWGTYNIAILEDLDRWGVSAHFVDDDFDTGPLIATKYFDVDCSRETALSLQLRTQPVLLSLFKEVLSMALTGKQISGAPQAHGRSFTKKEVMARRFVLPTDPPELVDRKVRAFWYPPNPPAEIAVGRVHYPVINTKIFNELTPLVCRYSEWIDTDKTTP